jgi:AraC-like DNA-binding protein
MILHRHTPAPPLDTFVEQFWHCADTPSHPRERILPSGTVELVVNLRDDQVRVYHHSHPARPRRLSGAVVSGPYGRFFAIDPLQHAAMMGVHFRPGGAPAVLGVPAVELADTHLDLDQLWGPAARELRERLCEAATPAARFSVLEVALAARLDRTAGRHGAVPVALDAFEQAGTGVRVRDIARRVGLSQRWFIRVFAAEVGLTPKLYGRVRRFQRALALVRGVSAPDWAWVAAECGHFDQSHLIRDFRAFSGLTPEEYLCRRSEQVLHNHVLQPG